MMLFCAVLFCTINSFVVEIYVHESEEKIGKEKKQEMKHRREEKKKCTRSDDDKE